MMQPKKTKFRKAHKGRIHGVASSGATLSFGQFGLKAMAPERITARQIEAARMSIQRKTKRQGKLFIRIFPSKPVTKKPQETRQGKGKGAVDHWVAVIKAGRVLYEIEGVEEELAREAFRVAGHKLPIKTQFMARRDAL